MLVHMPDHFSSKLNYSFVKTPASVTDRSSLLWAFLGLFFGSLLLWLGCFEFLSFVEAEKSEHQSFLMVEIFALIVILIGLGLIIYAVLSFVRYKKFLFDGENFHIVYRPAIGIKHKFKEPLSNYIGVRLRVLFIQSGLFNKNRYIIDLYHQDSNKIVPLYISTKAKNIRKLWENYAKMFELPALSVGDRGVVFREYTDLDKSVRDLALENKLPYIASGQLPVPESFDVRETKSEVLLKPKGIYWDIFSSLFLVMALAVIFVLIAGGLYLTIVGEEFPLKYWGIGGALGLFILYLASNLFKSYSLIIKETHVSVIEKLFGITLREDILEADKIENVELSYNPTIGRYSLTIISDDKLMTFGSRLPVADLLWLRDFVIRKLIGN